MPTTTRWKQLIDEIGNDEYNGVLRRIPTEQVIIFGAGSFGKRVKKRLLEEGKRIVAFCDNDRALHHHLVEEVPVITPEELSGFTDTTVVVASSWHGKIAPQLDGLGVAGYVVAEGYLAQTAEITDIQGTLEKFEWLYRRLADDTSRSILEAVLRGRFRANTSYFTQSPFPQYFHPKVRIEAGDVVVDGGAWIGDTAIPMAQSVAGDCTIYAFEADPDNLTRLREAIAERHLQSSIHPVPLGLWSSRQRLRFSTELSNSSQCKLDENGNQWIDVTALDEWFPADQPLDLIKMDIEGAEYEALLGARRLIEQYQPKLQISIYHRLEHLTEIPRLIHSWLPHHRLYLGHHSPSPSETILYACA